MSASTLVGLIEVALQSQRGAFSGIVAVDAIEVEKSAMPAALRVRTAHLTMPHPPPVPPSDRYSGFLRPPASSSSRS
jgi:hypothetical protein